MSEFAAVVLAAGLGTRMRSAIPKVAHNVCGRPMVSFVLDAAQSAGAAPILVVVGYGADMVARAVGERASCVVQHEQLGTGHAVMQAEAALSGYEGTVAILAGDAVFLSADDLAALVRAHRESGASGTILSAVMDDPTGYGRVVRGAAGEILRVVEERDATPEVAAIKEANSSIYCFEKRALFEALRALERDNAQREYYLTDVIGIMVRRGLRVCAVRARDPLAAEGINTRAQLARAERIFRDRVRERLMGAGVTLMDPPSTFVDFDVVIGRDTVLMPFTIIEGRTTIAERCTVGPFVRMVNSRVAEGAQVSCAMVVEAEIGPGASVGPYSYLRPEAVLRENARVGTFVEVKKSVIGRGSKVPHLTYLGDATVGEGVNVGAGTITCNYDGRKKYPTIIEDGAFIGSNSNLVAPVRVGKGAYVAAGSTITSDVPPGALGIARGMQRDIPGWVERKFGPGRAGQGHDEGRGEGDGGDRRN